MEQKVAKTGSKGNRTQSRALIDDHDGSLDVPLASGYPAARTRKTPLKSISNIISEEVLESAVCMSDDPAHIFLFPVTLSQPSTTKVGRKGAPIF